MWRQQEARSEVHSDDKSGGAGGDVHARLPPGPVVVTPAEHTWRHHRLHHRAALKTAGAIQKAW